MSILFPYEHSDATRPAVRGHVGKYATRTINFLQLNINGIYGNQKVQHWRRPISTGGGLAFLVKTSEVKYIEVLPNFPPHSTTEAQSINILLPEHTITVINAYHPDTAPIDTLFFQDLQAETKIIFGDLNTKSPFWGNNLLDAKGKQIEDLIDDLNLTILNTGEITFVSKTNGTASALDITAISYLSADKTRRRVLESAINDYYSVLTSFSMDQDSPVQVKRSWNYRKANWDGFTQELEKLCSNLPEQYNLEELISLFTRNIRNAAKHHIPRGKRKDSWIPFWKDQNTEELIHEKDSISQKLQVNNNEELRRKLVEISHKVEDQISVCKQKKWAELCSSLDPRKRTSQYGNLIKILTNSSNSNQMNPQSNVLAINDEHARTNIEAAKMLAKQYEKTSKLMFSADDRSQYKTYKSIIENNKITTEGCNFISDLTLEEPDSAIHRLDPNKSPGPDVIFGQMTTHFGENVKRFLLNIFNASWCTGKLPKIWKNSIIIPILNPGKNATICKSYRPISLTCILCKLMERIIHRRIMDFLVKNNLLHFYQTAYRTKHSTVDQLFYLSHSVINGFEEKPHRKTVAVFLDLSAAFDRVWRQKPIHIHSTGIKGNALLWINDFLRGGVATGNMKENEHDIVQVSIKRRGFTPIDKAYREKKTL
ncbi:reverse transcriptase domain-containing protein [Caerostris darwini]|uniref:Reverse transcriptase domain-containing protein n=1 Tax=Caerostris darwini TaxID=1538125 RepID=A0AAV4S1A8_9ARAC|nr:reverse transcriptase domain-containing protein [Caerostris darwini]